MQAELDDFPQDVLEEVREGDTHVSKQQDLIRQAAAKALVAKKDNAVQWRSQSGIEQVWIKCEEAYLGIDDLNRAEFQGAQWSKPLTMTGALVRESNGKETGEIRSTVYPRLTARYVDAAYAKLTEIILPPNDKAFSLEPTPVPDLINQKDSEEPVPLGAIVPGQPMDVQALRDPKPEEMAQAGLQPPAQATSPLAAPAPPASGQPGAAGAPPAPGSPQAQQAPGVPMQMKDIAEEIIANARKSSDKAEKRIYDWMVEGGYRAECRKAVFDAAKLGVGVVKGPYLTIQKTRAVTKEKGPDGKPVWRMEFKSQLVPAWKRVNPWDFYPDKSCGDDPKNGDGVFERVLYSQKQLLALIEEEHYFVDQIMEALAEGPTRRDFAAQNPSDTKADDNRFEGWLYQGLLDVEDFEVLQSHLEKDQRQQPDDPKAKFVYVDAAMVNDRVIKCVLQPLDSGDCRYHTFPWTRREGHWAGVGVAEQCFVPQKIVTAATRAMLDNAGKSAGVQIVMGDGVYPSDGNWQMMRDKIWKMAGDVLDDVRKAFNVFEIPNHQAAFMAVIEYAFRLAEESTNIPLITQGQSGDTTPDTLGGMQLQNNNANQLLRAVGYAFDDYVTEPTVIQCYELLILDPDIPDDEKGDFKINAKGSAALVERAIQNQLLAQQLSIAKDPAFGINPRKLYAEWMRSNLLDPTKVQYTKEEQAKLDSQPQPQPPQIEVAKIRADVDGKKLEADQNLRMQELQMEHDLRMQEIQAKTQLAMLEYANSRQMTMEQVKTELATTAMKLKTQREMAAEDRTHEVLKPPTEPAGRAQPGKSFQQ
jgi:hypothetical protein